MSEPTMNMTVSVDAKEAIAALNELTAAAERARIALAKITVEVEPVAKDYLQSASSIRDGAITAAAIRDTMRGTGHIITAVRSHYDKKR